jgi:hypothetical protein
LEFNRQREKTFSQKMREAEKLKEITAARAREKQQAQGKIGRVSGELGGRPKKEEKFEKPLSLKSDEGVSSLPKSARKTQNNSTRTDAKVASTVGMKRDTFTKAEKVYQKAESGDERAQNRRSPFPGPGRCFGWLCRC